MLFRVQFIRVVEMKCYVLWCSVVCVYVLLYELISECGSKFHSLYIYIYIEREREREREKERKEGVVCE